MSVCSFITTAETFDFVSPSDPSVDLEKSNIGKYWETLDLDHLVFKACVNPGDEPTVFTLAPLGSLQRGLAISSVRESLRADSDTAKDGSIARSGIDFKIACNHVLKSLRAVTGLYEAKKKPGSSGRAFARSDFEFTPIQLKVNTYGVGATAYQEADQSILKFIPNDVIENIYTAIIISSHPTELEKKS